MILRVLRQTVAALAVLVCPGMSATPPAVITADRCEGTAGETVTVSLDLHNEVSANGLQVLFEVPSGSGISVDGAQATGRASGFAANAGIRNGRASVMLYSTEGATIPADDGPVVVFSLHLGQQPLDVSLPLTVKLTDAGGTLLEGTGDPLMVVCRQAKAVYSSNSIDFGRVALRQAPRRTFTVSNVGTSPLVITELRFGSEDLSSPTELPLTVPAEGSAPVEVQFEPTERGSFSATVNLICNSPLTFNYITVTGAPYAVNELHVGNASGIADSVVTVPLTVNNMDPINGMTLEFDIPRSLQYVDSSFTLGNRASGHRAVVNVTGSRLRINMYSPTNAPIEGNDGEIGTFQVRLLGKGTVSLTPAKTVLSAFYRGKVLNVVSDVYGGTVTISYPTVSVTNRLSVGRTPVTDTARIALPVSNYGNAPLTIERVVTDNPLLECSTALPLTVNPWQEGIVELRIPSRYEGPVDGILQLYCNDPDRRLVNIPFSGERYAPDELLFLVPSVPRNAGTMTVNVEMDNYDPICGVQFDLELPPVLTPGDGFTPVGRAAGFSLTRRSVAPHTERYFIYSLTGDSITPGSGTVFELPFAIDSTATSGAYDVKVSGIRLSTPALTEKHSQLGTPIFQVLLTRALARSIALDCDTIHIDDKGSLYLTPIILPEDALPTVAWSSDDTYIATVDDDGKVTGRGHTGETYINAVTTDGSDLTARCMVSVKNTTGVSIVVADKVWLLTGRGTLTVCGADPQDVVTLTDAGGKILYRGTEKSFSSLPSGIYLITVGPRNFKVVL